MLEQGTIDIIASIDFFRSQSLEIGLFHAFFTQKYDIKDLMFFLYMRSLAEKECGQVITRLASGDIR